jgi:soluble lytic murein transglycosylase
LALARLHFATGQAETAKQHLRRAWLSAEIDAAAEKQILNEFGSKLSEKDRRDRVWALVLAQESNAAIRNAKRIGGSIEKSAETALHLLRFTSGADRKYQALGAETRSVPALKYALARYYRKNEKFSKARLVLESIPHSAADVIDPESIWVERRIIARRTVANKTPDAYRSAYEIASRNGLTSGEAALEAQFLSGWIALRYLKDAETALKHFSKLEALADSRTEKARALYWQGRALSALKRSDGAKAKFDSAARFGTIYYGQLAREEIGLGHVAQKVPSGEPHADAVKAVERDEVVRAMRLYIRTSGEKNPSLFLNSLAQRFDSADQMNAVASIIHDIGGTSAALRFAKAVGRKGIDIDAWSYPVRGLPDWTQAGKPVERALVFALSRQESEFNPTAKSQAGAIGLMQILPTTAKLIASQNNIAYAPQRLQSDPAYNVKLGAAHLADLIHEYRGSYILTLVAYNAGPRRVTEWIDAYGDPRSSKVDPIDWVESIPFHETRQYVQKVMQNMHIYRSRLAPKTVAPMTADLKRGSPAKLSALTTGSVSPAGCETDSKTACD